jgi:hypothetical protein
MPGFGILNAHSRPGTRHNKPPLTSASNCRIKDREKFESTMKTPASIFRIWAASVKLADVMNVFRSSTTMHLAWREVCSVSPKAKARQDLGDGSVNLQFPTDGDSLIEICF